MYKICLFAGTTEGRELAEFLTDRGVAVTACVATEYGKALLAPSDNLTVSSERLSEEEMCRLFAQTPFDLVIDATHPYASEVTDHIAAACAAMGTDYLRVLREGSDLPESAVFVPDVSAAVTVLNEREGNILLTTGSKDLADFASIRGFSERVYARVLPTEESLRACRDAGLPPARILAMQGPYTEELNAALLRAVRAAILVTKDGGSAGGFREKAAAAAETGTALVVIGRPPQREGVGFSEAVALLCERFGLEWRPRVTVAGIGPGAPAGLTEEVRAALDEADCVIGAGRMLTLARPGQTCFEAVAPEAIRDFITDHREYRHFVVLLSGDTGFFSGARRLLPLLTGCDTEVLPGISSLACLCARLRTDYEDVVCVSLHGREHDIVPDVRANARVFVLTGGADGVGTLCERLAEAGLGQVTLHVGERLSYPDERLTTGTAAELAGRSYAPLSAVLIENPAPDAVVTPGLPDEAFVRADGVPMTKSEVRAVCLSKLCLTERSVCWDVGAGTGSVSVEMARLSKRGSVYAIERDPAAIELLKENKARHRVENLSIVCGAAPAACEDLPSPTHVFLGGSGGALREIIELACRKNPAVCIVATAVTLESAAVLTACRKELPFAEAEVVSLTVARERKAGPYHLMTGQNPVTVFTFRAGDGT